MGLQLSVVLDQTPTSDYLVSTSTRSLKGIIPILSRINRITVELLVASPRKGQTYTQVGLRSASVPSSMRAVPISSYITAWSTLDSGQIDLMIFEDDEIFQSTWNSLATLQLRTRVSIGVGI